MLAVCVLFADIEQAWKMNPTSPTLDEGYTGYDDTQICSPFLSESQLNLTTRTDGSEEIESAAFINIPADVSSTSETLDIPFFPTLISSSISGPSSESAIADRSSSGPSEQQFFIKKPGVTQTDPPYPILNSVSSSEICSLDEPIPPSLVDFPTPEMLTTLERNITQPHVDQSRFSGGPIAQLDMPSNLSIDSKPIIKSEEFYAPESHEENFKTLGIIRPLVEDRPMSETVQAMTVYNLPKSLALKVLGLAPLQSSSRSLAAVETSPVPSCSIMIKQCDKNSTELARSQGSSNSTLESNVVTVEAAESVNSFQTTASTIAETKLANTTAKLTPNTEVENYLESLLCVKRVPRSQPNRFHDRPVTREPERNRHFQPPVCSSRTLRPRIMSQTMATSWSPTGLTREVNRQAPRSASTSPLVARKIYLNHITGGALWSFQESSACLPHSCTHSGLVVEAETWSNEDRPIWCAGSGGSLNRKVVCDYENMEKWPWPPKKQDVAFDQSSIGSRVGTRSNPGSSNLITGLDTPSHQPRTITSADPRVPNTPPEAGFLPLPDSPNDLLRLAQTTVGQWYLPDINPTEVRKRLEQQPAGRFIIRRSNREHNHYHLAFTTGNGEVRRVTLELTPAGYTVKGLSQGRYYPTIAHLVADHCSQVSILPCLLRLPGYKSVSKHAGCFSSPSVSSSSTANFNWFMRNRLSSQMNGIGGPLTEYQTFTPFPQVWTRRMVEPRGITDTWTDQIPVPPVPPHRTSNANERFRNQFQRPAYSLLPQGAACQLFYLGGFEVLFRPGPQAVQLCTDHLFGPERNAVQLTRVNFRVNEMGITVTDLDRKLFIQRQYPIACVLYMGLDPRGRRWKSLELYNEGMVESRIFGFVAANQTNPSGSSQCHLFCEYDLSEPANVICDFTNRYLNLLEV